MQSAGTTRKKCSSFSLNFGCARKVYNLSVDNYYKHLEAAGYTSGDKIPKVASLKASELKKEYPYLKEADSLGIANSLMDFSEAVRRLFSISLQNGPMQISSSISAAASVEMR